MMKKTILAIAAICLAACGNTQKSTTGGDTQSETSMAGPEFSADSAYAYCAAQCAFGPRTMNSAAHDSCEQWIADKFRSFGLSVALQRTTISGFDGTPLACTNIIAGYKPELKERILLCAHWDSRPWADNDPDPANRHTPVMGANDGASGVAVMLEAARLIAAGDSLGIGVDFICFDAEDRGIPSWSDDTGTDNSWALGSAYWAAHPHKAGYKARFGILLDMVGGQGATFYQEGFSTQYASAIVDRVWAAASACGYGSLFPAQQGGTITDDHVAINQTAGIPTIDIIPYYPDCSQSGFGPTWHTVNDTMENIDPNTLKAVGQTVMQVLFEEGAR